MYRIQVTKGQLTGGILGSLNAQRDTLTRLLISGCPVNDLGLQTQPELSKLQYLDLSGTLVSDEGFRNFKVSPELSIIKVTNTKVTKAWAQEFTRQHLGKLAVSFEGDPRWPPHGAYCEAGGFMSSNSRSAVFVTSKYFWAIYLLSTIRRFTVIRWVA